MSKNTITGDVSNSNLNHAAISGLTKHLEEFDANVVKIGSMVIGSATNEEKYSNYQLPYGSHSDLVEVFELMRSLNYRGITDASVGVSASGGYCLADTFNQTCDIIAERYYGQTIDYVELGPEPVKTELLVSALRARGVDIAGYTSVDINPSSAKPMREVISRVWSKIEINHLAMNFNDITATHLGNTNPVVFTSLGFQEGNHTPLETYDLLKRIMRPGDVYLAEMQIYSPHDHGPIDAFYQLDEMKRFSKNCLRRAYGDIGSCYGASITDIDVDGAVYKAAICHEQFVDDGGQSVYFVTNYCLKYTKDELRELREGKGEFAVISELTSGDGSLELQLCERVADPRPK